MRMSSCKLSLLRTLHPVPAASRAHWEPVLGAARAQRRRPGLSTPPCVPPPYRLHTGSAGSGSESGAHLPMPPRTSASCAPPLPRSGCRKCPRTSPSYTSYRSGEPPPLLGSRGETPGVQSSFCSEIAVVLGQLLLRFPGCKKG